MNNQQALPSLASYKPQCQHSSENWLVYQTGLTDIRLIEFNSNSTIKESHAINIGPQPLRCARVVYSHQNRTPYIALAFLTRYVIYQKNQVIISHTLHYQCNISDFDDGFVAAEGINDGLQTYFVFVTSKGLILNVPVDHPENKVEIIIEPGHLVSGLCTKNSIAYLGTQAGMVLKVDLNSRKVDGIYDSSSKLPIINMKLSQNHVILGTCQGQLHILDQNLKQSKVLSAHQSTVSLLLVSNQTVYSIGDDLIMRVWQLSKDGSLQQTKHRFFNQKPNMLFKIGNTVYLNFYEDSNLVEI